MLGDEGYAKEPQWNKIEQMPVMEFHKGLRERNWTHADYRKDASPWNVAFFEDSGRFMRPSFDGYRSLSVSLCHPFQTAPLSLSQHQHQSNLNASSDAGCKVRGTT